MTFMPNLVGIFVFGTYLAIICEVTVAGGFVMEYMHKNVGSIHVCPCSIMAMWVICEMWQVYLLSDIKYVYSYMEVDLVQMHTYVLSYMYTYIHIQTHACLVTYITKCIYSYVHSSTHRCQHT